MNLFYKARANWLSKNGAHTAALSLAGDNDVRILSRAGMHLAVLKCSAKPSVERAIALARIEEVEAAFEVVQLLPRNKVKPPLVGLLAALAPERVIEHKEILADMPGVYAYCLSATGKSEDAAKIKSGVTDWHRIVEKLNLNDIESVKRCFSRIFIKSGLVVPDVEFNNTGINIRRFQNKKMNSIKKGDRKISIVLTAYNEESCIHFAIESLLSQTWGNLELIVVDDASTDSTCKIAANYAKLDSRIKLVRLEKNLGLWGAKNVGLQYCEGQFITMHDADDWSHPEKLEKQIYPLLENEKIEATSSYMVRVVEETGVPYTRNAANYLRWNPSSFMFRKKRLHDVGGFLDNLLGSDCEFVDRFETLYGLRSHQKFRLPLSIGLQRNGSLSNKYRSGEAAKIRIKHWEKWRLDHVAGKLYGPNYS